MCAINPTHKVRYIIDVYTSCKIAKNYFDSRVIDELMEAEIKLNSENPDLRFHIKETKQEAE